jgi:hypothetical protein
MSSPRIVYTPRSDATPEGEIAALASVYRFILFESSGRKEAAHPGDPADAMKGFGISEKKKGGEYVEHLPDSSSGIVHQRSRRNQWK